jgi:predicted Rossmann fold nucleotide-binding protein DprA/Smf involved in DNA uptake
MINTWEISEFTPPMGGETFFGRKPPKLWGVGDPALLNHRLLGIISARQIDSDLALRSSQLLKQLASLEGVSFISGWHSPLEDEALRILSADSAQIVFCVSKALQRFTPSMLVKNGIDAHRVLALTHCSPRAKRISRDSSLKRNELVVELAASLLVLSAPDRSASLKLAKSVVRQGKPVFTLDHRLNEELLASGASPATSEKIEEALR